MTKRKPLTRLQRSNLFDARDGVCCICHFKIDPVKSKWICEHINPLWRGGADDERNMAPAHYECAIKKTQQEAPLKAKSDRIRATERGIKKTIRNPIPGSRNSPFKKKMDGTVVLRHASND